eukprot:scaffold33623_cov59-Phaeocystis_antarctica.AAC.3
MPQSGGRGGLRSIGFASSITAARWYSSGSTSRVMPMRDPMSCQLMMSSTASTATGSLRASSTSAGGCRGRVGLPGGRRAARRSAAATPLGSRSASSPSAPPHAKAFASPLQLPGG